MPVGQNDICTIGATQMILGTLGSSVFPTVFSVPAGCVGVQLKLIGASGSSVCILPNAVSGKTISGATALTAIQGYPLVSGEMYPIMGPAQFYLGCAGASATIAVNLFFSSNGATLN